MSSKLVPVFVVFSSLLLAISIAQSTFYVKPTNDTPCPMQPCLTLSEYAQAGEQYFTSNTTFIFLPGDHYLRHSIIINKQSNIMLHGDATSLPRINSRIVCSGPVVVSCSNITHLEMSALDFIGCGALSLHSAESVKFTKTTFMDAPGGGLIAYSSSVTLEDSCFVNITTSSTGAISTHFSNITIKDSCFINNTATFGGAGIAAVSSELTFLGQNSFTENSAGEGAAIYGSESTMIFSGTNLFRENVAFGINVAFSFQATGGAIRVEASTVEFNGEITFAQNEAFTSCSSFICLSFGGGMYAQNSNITFGPGSEATFIGNAASNGGGGMRVLSSNITFGPGSEVDFNGNTATSGGGIYAAGGSIRLSGKGLFMNNMASSGGAVYAKMDAKLRCDENCTFVSNGGAAVWIVHGTANLSGHIIFKNNSGNAYGGAIYLQSSRLALIGYTAFVANNGGGAGAGIGGTDSNITCIGTSIFTSNNAKFGAAIDLTNSTVIIRGNTNFNSNTAGTAGSGGGINAVDFNSNTAGTTGSGGGINAVDSNFTFQGNTSFVGNKAFSGGGLNMYNCFVEFQGINTFLNSKVDSRGGALNVVKTTLKLTGNNVFTNNSAGSQGSAIYAKDTNLFIVGSTDISNNQRHVKGRVFVNNSIVEFEGNCTFRNNTASEGGAMYSRNSNVSMWGDMTIIQNMAYTYGGAFYFTGGRLVIYETATFINNTAGDSGGAFFITSSTLNFSDNVTLFNNSAHNQGGAILATDSSQLRFSGNQTLANNSARYGAAFYLAENSILSLVSPLELLVQNNMAERGAAFYYEDSISFVKDCTNIQLPVVELSGVCFLQAVNISGSISDIQLKFSDNIAAAGSVLYGGMLDRCRPNHYNGSGLMLLNEISSYTTEISSRSRISSQAFRICFCDENMQPNCDRQTPHFTVRRGEIFTITAVAAGQGNFPVQSEIRANFPSSNVQTINGESETCLPQTNETCTELNYRVFSNESSVFLRLYPNGPCGDVGTEKLINVTLLPCPTGFEQANSECTCDKRLEQFTTICNIDNSTVERSSNFWLSPLYRNRTYIGLILHPQCPFDYCIRPPSYIDPSNPDSQCDFNHSGILCGSCEPELSVAFGSFHCLQCSNTYLALLVPFALAGIILVFLLFLLQLTVAMGTVNGLIFYANIVAGSKAIFLPYGDTNFLTVFVAWLNLDLGIETCFYDGMDAYARTWLQFVFPVYVWMLVGLVILVSRYSPKITRILGKHHPVPVLATLFLLSYAKVLRTIITALSVTFLDYPDGSSKAVWLYDGSVEYLRGKHIPLFLAALIALIVLFLPYTFLLLMGQWLQAYSGWKVFSWMNKIKPFMDAYHGPYKSKTRFWTGLLLLLRCALFLVFAFNTLGNPSIDLLAIASVMFGLTVMAWLTGMVYEHWYLDALESFFILNIGILAVATYHVKNVNGNQNILTYISMGTAFVMFFGVILYHLYIQTKETTLCIKIRKFRKHSTDEDGQEEQADQDSVGSDRLPAPPTVSYVQLREPLLN